MTRGEEDGDAVTGAGGREGGLGALARGLARGQGGGRAHSGGRGETGDLETRTRDEGHDDEEGHTPCAQDHVPPGHDTRPEPEQQVNTMS